MRNKLMSSDQTIDRVLKGLATSDAPPNMEQRLLNALQSRATGQQKAPPALFSFPPPGSRHPERSAQREVEGPRGSSRSTYVSNFSATPFQPWAIAAGLIILSLAATLAVRRRHEPVADVAVHKEGVRSQASPAPQLAEAQPERAPERASSSAAQPETNVAFSGDINDMEALAISEMNAPSKPAPPLPLTHQEQLLAGTVRQAGDIDLSSLRPEVRDIQMELSKAEFHDFFDPPLVKESE